ncbi:MAG TPA: class I SAM-dependent methyltransferase [Gammaproteobacteria bacterium]|nr:class I SAM-dependent methyltransferase [Gammaproteobacteria bacterium]
MTDATLDAYERWAASYPPVAHNPLMRAEQRLMTEEWPAVRGQRVLDLACGSGRYTRLLCEADAAQVVGMDFCLPMLERVATASRICASMMQLPFKNGTFGAVVSGLAVGHAGDIHEWMSEIERVLLSGGTLLYSDFHPEAARAGMTRSFKDRSDAIRIVPHRLHDVEAQLDAARAANLNIEAVREVRVGIELREPFMGSEKFYRERHGLPVVLVVRARKPS